MKPQYFISRASLLYQVPDVRKPNLCHPQKLQCYLPVRHCHDGSIDGSFHPLSAREGFGSRVVGAVGRPDPLRLWVGLVRGLGTRRPHVGGAEGGWGMLGLWNITRGNIQHARTFGWNHFTLYDTAVSATWFDLLGTVNIGEKYL